MSDLMLGNTTTTDFENVQDFYYSTPQKVTDGNYAQKENKWTNSNASKYYGVYYDVGEYRAAINAFATWVIGQGYDCDPRTKVILENISGWGEDTFLSVIWNLISVKKFNGDAYAEIMRNDNGTLINLKPLDPRRMTHITNQKGQLERFEYQQADGQIKKFDRNDILHFCNDRILDEPHGTAVTSAVEWVCDALKEAYRDWRRSMHKSSLLIFYVDEQDTARQTTLKTQMANGIKNGDVMIITCRPEEARLEPSPTPPAEAWRIYMDNLENKFYRQLGVPKVVLGGTAENTEASAKVGVIAYEPIWTREISELEADLWNQLAIKITIRKQPSLMDNMQTDESKNTGQTKLKYQGSQ
jgi:hypothetical protein